MIKIPFDRCVILSTLDFEQIMGRLKTAIYDPHWQTDLAIDNRSKSQNYYGQIRGFKFSASRIVGHKSIHLPLFLSPMIEGNINALSTGYEISLTAKLHNVTFVLLLTWLGGMLTASSIVFEKILLNIYDDLYFNGLGIFAGSYLAVIAYFYFASWCSTRFFKALFTQGLTGITKIRVTERQQWTVDLQQANPQKSAPD